MSIQGLLIFLFALALICAIITRGGLRTLFIALACVLLIGIMYGTIDFG